MVFVETIVFTKRIQRLGLEGALKDLQERLLRNPETGALDPGTGGVRKVRMADPSRGKGTRGGARVHYLWLPHVDRVYLLFAYSKDEATTLSQAQKAALKAIVDEIKDKAR